ncbi:MAG: response regulator transcription factor [Spirochaetales bacterium]|nr:response regulator transcription factor [Spirochaetales bacterium]
MSYSIVLAEDQSLIRNSLCSFLSMHPELEVLASAADGAEALNLCREFTPDLAVLDIRMPLMNGLEVAQALKRESSRTRTVLLTTFEEDQVFSKALNAGVEGIFLKDIEPDLFALSLTAVARGLLVYHPAVKKQMECRDWEKGPPRLFGLTDRDMDLIRYIAEGRSNKAIADQMRCTEGTIKNRVSSVLGKMGLEDRTQIAVYAIRHNLLDNLD